MFLLTCPKCRNHMKYQPKKRIDRTNIKRCVYCGKSFIVVDNILQRL